MMSLTVAFEQMVQKQRDFFVANQPFSLAYRQQQLDLLKQVILNNEAVLTQALADDLGKPKFESYVAEIGFVLHEISTTIKQLKHWLKPRKVKTPLLSQPATSYIHSTPLGVCLIISPFNYPVSLTLSPLIAAIAAGNCCVLKTSELTPNVSRVLKQIIDSIFKPEYVTCINGDVEHVTCLLAQKFDHIFFTGSTEVGKLVMQQAAKNLTPVTLELGGKSPCIVCADANLDIAVKRIVYGKMLNAGQTCVAPDYVLVDDAIKSDFLAKIAKRIQILYGDDARLSEDFGRIINSKHTQRISKLIDTDKAIVGGQYDIEHCYIAPTVLENVELTDPIMQQEVFGPVLPVLSFSEHQDILNIIHSLPSHPLTAYIFSEDNKTQEQLTSAIQAGGMAINHCIQHLVNPHLPFGGVGLSGIGSYHGKHGFDCFSHKKSVLKAATWFDLPVIYPPYKHKLFWLKKILK
ncbi:aldehyde dehydrogenase [Psychromonas sp. RZ22]|uniref:aldehyde dehydrogenase n=1 Tax=Psychromonas algarum TaxID=2555643 RepID=UPI001067B459|nr:aldehyde dehydrogenase [Psychromonas sp. RZ22]TEW53304.1 aldehyde dehydrogenase [Psychromonas sp. RZ22]